MLAERFGLPLWRFGNSGTEATMDAVHLMRAATGRDLIVKIEGSYHGHHDTVMVSYYNEIDELGPRRRPLSVLAGTGIPQAIADLTLVVPFNDLDVLAAVLDEHRGRVAGMIMEPMMMNAGIIPPEPGYLEGVRRLTREHDVLLAFDEVKTGLTVGPGGATRLLGVATRHRVPGQGARRRRAVRCDRRYGRGDGAASSTARTSRSARSTATRSRWRRRGRCSPRSSRRTPTPTSTSSASGCGPRSRPLRRAGIPAYVRRLRRQGCVVFHPTRSRDYREFLAVHGELSHAHWLVQHNNGVFLPPWGKSEQWTLSVQHTTADADRFIDNVNGSPRPCPSLDRWVSADAVALTIELRAVGPRRRRSRGELRAGSTPSSAAAAWSTHARSSSTVTALSCTVTCTARPSTSAARRHAAAWGSAHTNAPAATPSAMTSSSWSSTRCRGPG